MERIAPEVRRRLEQLLTGPAQSRAQLRAIGLTERDIRRLHRNGWLRHDHGHYTAVFTAAEFATIKCTQAAFPGSVLSHFTAASLWELRTWVDNARDDAPDTAAVRLTRVPQSSRNETRDDVVVRRAGLPDADVVLRGHAPLTSRANRGRPRTRAPAARVDRLRRPRAAHCRHPHRAGAGDRPAAGLQATFRQGDRWMNERVDFWWPQYRTFAEAGGLAKYEAATPAERRALQRAAFVREQGLADLGLEMVRFGFEDAVITPAELAERIRRAFERGTARGIDVPWRTTDLYDRTLWPTHPPDDR
jgi:hypothetical protein